MRIVITAIFLLISFSSVAAGEFLTLHHLDAARDTYNNIITALCKQKDGFLWVGTSSGLCRYDGYNVRPALRNEVDSGSILTDYITDIQEDWEGKLWIQSQGRFGIYDPDAEKLDADCYKFLSDHGIDGTPLMIHIDSRKNIWISIEKDGLYRLREGEDKARKADYDASLHPDISSVALTPHGLAAVDRAGSIIWFDPLSLKVKTTVMNRDESARHLRTYWTYADNRNRLWVYSNEVLKLYDIASGKWITDRLPGGVHNGVVKRIFNDKAGNLWIARDHHGLEKVVTEDDGIKFKSVHSADDPMGENTITCIAEDDYGTLWIGTYKRGLLNYNVCIDKFALEDFPDVNCVAQGSDGKMWIGTDSSGLWSWDPVSGVKTLVADPTDHQSPAAITALLSLPDGRLLIGTFANGLREYSSGSFKKLVTNSPLDNNYVWTLATDREGNIWAGTLGGGVFRIDHDSGDVTGYSASDSGLTSDYVMTCMVSRDGNIYFGTSHGISYYNAVSGNIEPLHESLHMPNAEGLNVYQIYEDSRGLMWVATATGLKVIDRGHGKIFNVSGDDKVKHAALGVIEDNGGAMWVSIGARLLNIKVNYDEKTGELSLQSHSYDSLDGLQECDLNQRSFAKLPDGEIVVGGLYGLNRFSPADMKFNTARPKVIFTDVYAGNKRVWPGEMIDGRVALSGALNNGGKLELNHDAKEITVYFSTDNYALPQKTTYEYRLQGFSDEWLKCSPGVNHVTYTNLSPGTYRLMVRAINSDGYESEAPGVLEIKVYPAWWATTWAQLIYLVLIALAMWGVVRIVARRERSRFQRERREDARKKREELNQLKFKFFTNVSHDLRTPLTLIVSPLDEMIKETHDERQLHRLTIMKNNAMKLLALVNQLLDFRKNEVTGLQLNPVEGDIVSFSRNVCNSFVMLSERKNINLTFYSDRDSIEMTFDEDKMEKILMNLLGNAFKFTPSGGRVDVALEKVGEENPMLRIKISDTGIGVKDKDKPRIFERFYQVDDNGDSHPEMGSGIGLSMVSEYVKLHGGSIRVTDNVDKGSVFIIDMPIRHTAKKQAPMNAVPSDDEASTSSADVGHSEEPPHKKTDGKRRVALVVDDNPDMTDMLKFELEKDFEVIPASDGTQALEILESVRPDIILTDLMMPGMNGIELCRRLKGNEATLSIPVVILTAKHDLGVKLEGLTLGADDYITKPFNIDVLRIRMKRLVELTAKGARRTLIEPEPEHIAITSLDEKFIEKAMKYVSDHLDSPDLSVEELSDSLGMSRVRLYKKIKQITGKTPIEFIRVIRLKRAAQLLRESQLNVSEIAYRTGFNSPKLFSRYFKEEFGILPSVYQDKEGTETNYTI